MKSVFMIAYAFPPEGHAGVYRPLRFVRHLPAMGWSPTVITGDTGRYGYIRHDPDLLKLVPKYIEVIRVRESDPWQLIQAWRARRINEQQLSKGSVPKAAPTDEKNCAPIRSFLRETVRTAEAWCYHPDRAMGWIRPAAKTIMKRSARGKPNLIWATVGPVSSFIVAQQASQQISVPYVLDFRDAWTIIPTEFDIRRPKWARRLEQRKMFQLLKGAQAVIFRYDTEAECFWRAYQGAMDASKMYLIPNGYEGAIDQYTPPDEDKCKILYTGTLSDYRYDTLLDALCLLKQSSAHLAKQLHLHFVGEGAEALANDAAALDLSEMVTTGGPISHEEVTKLSNQAHALLILGRPSTMRGYELFAGAKLFGYLKTGMPIIGVVPADETKKVLLRVGVTTVADVDSRSEIVAVLCTLHEAWSQGKLSSLVPNRTACEVYSAERQTQELIRAFEGAPALEPFVAGSVEIPPSLTSEISNRARKFEQKRSLGGRQDMITRSQV
jgi:hypothetical protein